VGAVASGSERLVHAGGPDLYGLRPIVRAAADETTTARSLGCTKWLATADPLTECDLPDRREQDNLLAYLRALAGNDRQLVLLPEGRSAEALGPIRRGDSGTETLQSG